MVDIDNYKQKYYTQGINLVEGSRYVNFYGNGSNLIKEFFKEDVVINPDVVHEYTSITVNSVNNFNHKIDAYIMPHKVIERQSKKY